MGIALNKYKNYKNRMKAKYCDPWHIDEERLMHKPPFVFDANWKWLVHFWSSLKVKIIKMFV